ncbi:hypothetical protein BGZ60DRAFT_405125 [Tricladium varicosporioides]|nr:hypothetical protein BGZ60DRAFT_405125 [Hymenoscyphus varicosporioides]
MTTKNILITGSTGQQGSSLITSLLSQPQHSPKLKIFALTRNSSSPSALALAAKGVTLLTGSTTSPHLIFAQLPPETQIHTIFLVTLPGKDEREQAIPLITLAASLGVSHIIYSSVDRGGPQNSESEDTETGIPHFGVKMEIEKHLKKTCEEILGEMNWTILRPTSFMENLNPSLLGRIATTSLSLLGSTRISLISIKDIGRVAAMAVISPEKFLGRAITLTGDVITFAQMEKIFWEETGEKMPGVWGWVVRVLEWVVSDFGATMRWIERGGWDYDFDRSVKEKFGLEDIRTWLREDSRFESVRNG